jgi:predicted amidohydrolase
VLHYTGASQVVDTRGNLLSRAGENEEVAVVVDIDPSMALDKQINLHNNLFGDRRPDFYSDICKG